MPQLADKVEGSPHALIGREAECAALELLLEQARASGSGALIVLVGPRGIGKRSLVKQVRSIIPASPLELLVVDEPLEFVADLPRFLTELLHTAKKHSQLTLVVADTDLLLPSIQGKIRRLADFGAQFIDMTRLSEHEMYELLKRTLDVPELPLDLPFAHYLQLANGIPGRVVEIVENIKTNPLSSPVR